MKKDMFECGSCRTVFDEGDARPSAVGPECPFCGSTSLKRTAVKSSILRWLLKATSTPTSGGCGSRSGYS